MKLSQETLQVLKNFQAINTNLIMYPGNVLFTQNNGKSVFAMHEIAETIPTLVHVYDLPSLLGVLSLSDEPEITFNEASFSINNQHGGNFEYYYSDPAVVYGPPNRVPNLEKVYTFTITKEEISLLIKGSGILGATTFSVFVKNDSVYTTLGDPKTPSSNAYTKLIGEANGLDFDIRIAVGDLKMVPDNYEVSLTTKKFTMFKSLTKEALYVVTPTSQSRI
jgi:hypothetical protein